MTAYNSEIGLQNFVRNLCCLSLVPVHDVVRAWEGFVIKTVPEPEVETEGDDVHSENLDDFADYFDRTWIGR